MYDPDRFEPECFELPWPADWTLWIVLAAGFLAGFIAGALIL